MLKLVYCIRRRADIAPETFYRYWLEDHAPKVAGVAESIGAIRYVQSHTCLPEMNAELESGPARKPPMTALPRFGFVMKSI
jgi:hypothetical protein